MSYAFDELREGILELFDEAAQMEPPKKLRRVFIEETPRKKTRSVTGKVWSPQTLGRRQSRWPFRLVGAPVVPSRPPPPVCVECGARSGSHRCPVQNAGERRPLEGSAP